MATKAYMDGRKKYQRPQAMLWSDNSGTLVDGVYIPTGYEVGANTGSETNTSLFNEFLILTDDNRSKIDFKPMRIETRKRMINGRMRSYHIADKMQLTVSWEMIPSRSFALFPDFNSSGKPSDLALDGYREGYQRPPVEIHLTYSDEIIITIPEVTINKLSGNKIIPSTVTAVYSDDETIVVPEITIRNDSGILITIPSKTVIQKGVVIGAIRTPGEDTDGPTVQYVIPQHQIRRPGQVIGAQRVYGQDPDGTAITHLGDQYTTDGGAGGVEMLDWYNNHKGSFWVFLSYDNYANFGKNNTAYAHLGQYSEIVEMFFADFSYSVVKRGSSNYDFWNISITLEEA